MLSLLFVGLCVKLAWSAVPADLIANLPGVNGALPSKQYSGFLKSAPTHYMHYWFIESQGNPVTDPVVLWVQGGPGSSSMIGLFTEMGPYFLNKNSINGSQVPTLFANVYNWTQAASMLFWESPPGVGFSYCDGGCPAWNDTTCADDNYYFLCSFFAAYPEYSKNDFYIFGESYGGVYIPTVAQRILEDKNQCYIQLRGLGIGNGCTGTQQGPCYTGRFGNTLKQFETHYAVSPTLAAQIDSACIDSLSYTIPNSLCQSLLKNASDQVGTYYNYNIYDTCDPTSTLIKQACGWGNTWACQLEYGTDVSPLKNIYETNGIPFPNEGPFNDPAFVRSLHKKNNLGDIEFAYTCGGESALQTYLNNPTVKAAIHMPSNAAWPGAGIQYTRSEPNLLPLMQTLISKYRVLIYSGDFDGQIPTVATESWTRGLGYSEKAKWRPWYSKDAIAGYVVQYNVSTEFTFLIVKAAGHMVPSYAPEESLLMFLNYINGRPY